MANDERALLERLWWAGVRAVQGEAAVASSLATEPIPAIDAILAVGKAAASMARAGLKAADKDTPCLVLTKYGHSRDADLPDNVAVIEAAHPVPDERSLAAGAAALDFVSGLGPDSHLLLLVSGGASALVEAPKAGLTLADLARENARLLAEGLDIHAMNAHRRTLSRIKGGGLLSAFKGARVTSLAISDVEGDDLSVIGSGIGHAPPDPDFTFEARIVASNAIARAVVAQAAQVEGLVVLGSEEALYVDVAIATERLVGRLGEKKGLWILGGEPTIVLPENPGQGGRNQALALSVAREISGRSGLTVLVGGTDGSDGPTTSAGGIVDGHTWTEDGQSYLDRADSGTFLARRNALFETGPTGTNVMDIALALQV